MCTWWAHREAVVAWRLESWACNLKVAGSILAPAGIEGGDCEWTALSPPSIPWLRCPWARHRTPNWSPGAGAMAAHCSRCVFTVCVCVFTTHCCVCALGWVKCRAPISSVGHHTWQYITLLVIYYYYIGATDSKQSFKIAWCLTFDLILPFYDKARLVDINEVIYPLIIHDICIKYMKNTLPFKSLGSVRFWMFLMESLMLIKAVFIWSKIQKKTLILWNIIAIFNIGFLF